MSSLNTKHACTPLYSFDRLFDIMQVLLIGGSTGTMLEALDVVGDDITSIEVSLVHTIHLFRRVM